MKIPRLSFSFARKSYHENDHVQREVENKLKSVVSPHLKKAHSILELGCGDGRSSISTAEKLEAKYYDAMDVADVLVSNARETVMSKFQERNYPKFNFFVGDFDNLKCWKVLQSNNYNFIYSNMALQWSKCFITLLQRIEQALVDDGILAFSIPIYGTFRELESIVRINQFMTHQQVLSHLNQLSCLIVSSEEQRFEVIFKDRYSQLQHLKNTGVNSYLGNENPKFRSLRKYLINPIMQNSSKVELGYQIGFYVVRKNDKYRDTKTI